MIEAREAREWYAERDVRAAQSFGAALDEVIDRVAAIPGVGSPWPALPSVRRAAVGGFPYWVVYEEGAGVVVIVAVAHHKRRPGYWRER